MATSANASLGMQWGQSVTAALIMGAGSSSNPIPDTQADKNFFGYWLTESSATGTTRGEYIRLYLTGGAGGEAIRAFLTNSAAAPVDTINGAHISLSHSGSGNVSGLATAVRATYHVPSANLTGTNASVQAELYADGTGSNVTGNGAFIRFSLDGNATGVGKLDDTADLLRLDGMTIGAGNILATKTAAAVSHTARISIGGTTYWLMLSDAQ